MKEALLHFIWKFQKFNKSDLTTSGGQALEIFHNGQHNHHAGPDFAEAKIKLDGILWYGSVELHVKSSEWKSHGHHRDKLYNNVILHVVWEENKPAIREDGQLIHTLELRDRVDPEVLYKCNSLVGSPATIPCAGLLSQTKTVSWTSMLHRAGVERLEHKANEIKKLLEFNWGDWEETTYQLLARNFGFKINNEPFLKLSKALPIKILRKHAGNLFQIEALLFGTSGLLKGNESDQYKQALIKEYKFLSQKYSLSHLELYAVEWKFLRLRPGNFPTVRIAQFAALINENPHLFNTLTELRCHQELVTFLRPDVSQYWTSHYNFEAESKRIKSGQIGTQSVQNLIINTAAPLLAAYARYTGNPQYMNNALFLLESLGPEENNVTKRWVCLNKKPTNALDSQSLIQLYHNYCLKKKCLSCKIGVEHINRR